MFCILTPLLPPQDVGFPFMQDPRLPEDTLFLCFEQDFRWYERDCLQLAQWLPWCVNIEGDPGQQHAEEPPGPPSPPPSPEDGAARPSPEPEAGDKGPRLSPADQRALDQAAGRGVYHRVHQQQRPVDAESGVSREVWELVAACNEAHRNGCGDIVWFAYNCDTKKDSANRDFVHHGSQGVAYTKSAARLLEKRMWAKDCKPQLFDLWLLNLLGTDWSQHGQKSRPWRDLNRSSYISPPLGGFYEHETLIVDERGGKTRPSLFGATWAQEGSVSAVRPTDNPRQLRRWDLSWTRPTPPGPLACDLPAALQSELFRFTWKTMHPPPHSERNDPTALAILRELQYVEDGPGFPWCGPKLTKDEGWTQKWDSWQKKYRWHLRTPNPQLELMRRHPDEPQVRYLGPLSRLGWKLCCHPGAARPGSGRTLRDERRQRETVTRHSRRAFAPWALFPEVFGGAATSFLHGGNPCLTRWGRGL